MTAAPLLAVSGLSKAFGGLRAVDGLDLELAPGETLGLIGPNGSGKTTVLNLLTGALACDAGSVRFGAREMAGAPAHRVTRAGMARTFQLVRPLRGMSVAENVRVGALFARPGIARAEAEAATQEALVVVGLDGHAARPAETLTYIDQKRMELARALAGRPSLLLLDEFLAGLNPTELDTGIALLRGLQTRGLAMLLVEHVMRAVRELCHRCVVMSAGRVIAAGTPGAVLADPEVLAVYLGDEDA